MTFLMSFSKSYDVSLTKHISRKAKQNHNQAIKTLFVALNYYRIIKKVKHFYIERPTNKQTKNFTMLRITRITLIMLLPLLLVQLAVSSDIIIMAQSIEDEAKIAALASTSAAAEVHAPNMIPIRRLRSTTPTVSTARQHETARELRMIVALEEFSRLLRVKNGEKKTNIRQNLE
jgi:hypothetical protein